MDALPPVVMGGGDGGLFPKKRCPAPSEVTVLGAWCLAQTG